jgi:hypothetical protein
MNNLLSFIEEIVVKYDLEKDLIENDADLKNVLSKAKDMSDRVFLKFIYSNKIANYEKQNLILDIPSMRLKNIINNLIDKKISINDLPALIQQDLKISPEISEKITEDIKNNKEIIEEINNQKPINENDFSPEKSEKDTPKTSTKSIGYELLK